MNVLLQRIYNCHSLDASTLSSQQNGAREVIYSYVQWQMTLVSSVLIMVKANHINLPALMWVTCALCGDCWMKMVSHIQSVSIRGDVFGEDNPILHGIRSVPPSSDEVQIHIVYSFSSICNKNLFISFDFPKFRYQLFHHFISKYEVPSTHPSKSNAIFFDVIAFVLWCGLHFYRTFSPRHCTSLSNPQ